MNRYAVGMLMTVLAVASATAQEVTTEAQIPPEAAAFMMAAQDDLMKIKADIEAAGNEAASAQDKKTRAAAWKKVVENEAKFFKLINNGKNGVKLPKPQIEAARQLYYQQAVARITQVEARLVDPEAKKFFAEKKAAYAKKIAKPKAAKKPAKKAAKPAKSAKD